MQPAELPAGWTQHTLTGRTFYFHKDTNKTQTEHPGVPVPRPEASAPPAPSAVSAVSAPPSLPEPLQATEYTSAPPAPAPAGEQIQILVPCGAEAGQRITFNAPDGQVMSVTVQEAVPPHTTLAVQYQPLAGAAPTPVAAHSQPQTAAPVQQPAGATPGIIQGTAMAPLLPPSRALDSMNRSAAELSWGLFLGSFVFCLCGCPFLMPCVWLFVAGMYYWDAPEQRIPGQRLPALLSLGACGTMMACMCCIAVVMVVAVAVPEFKHAKHVPTIIPDTCGKYTHLGPRAVHGCKWCVHEGLNQTDQCLSCGRRCYQEFCDEKKEDRSFLCATPMKYPDLLGCTKQCYLKSNVGRCYKYHDHPDLVQGCEKCLKAGLDDTDTCMSCGQACYKELCSCDHCHAKPSELCKTPEDYPLLRNCTQRCYNKDKVPQDSCDNYDDAVAKKGCYTCKSIAPNKVDKCMSCGEDCYNHMCKHNKSEECFKEAVSCAKKCVLKDDETLLV